MSNDIVRLYLSGYSIYEIAKAVKLSPTTIYNILISMGIKTNKVERLKNTRKLHKLTPEDIEEIKKLYYELGKPQKEIAGIFNINQSHVSHILKKYKEVTYEQLYPNRRPKR